MRDAAHHSRQGSRDEAIITLLYDTGLRRSELSAIDRSILDLDESELRIPAHIQKDYPNENSPNLVKFALDRSGQLRTVRTLRSYLSTRDRDTEALFPSQKAGRMTGKGINDVVKRAAERAEVRPYCSGGRGDHGDVTAHTLRHSLAWRMLRSEDGNTFYDVRNRLRHATALTTKKKYNNFDRI